MLQLPSTMDQEGVKAVVKPMRHSSVAVFYKEKKKGKCHLNKSILDGKTLTQKRTKPLRRFFFWVTCRVSAAIEASGVLLRSSQQDKAPPQGTTQGVVIGADMHLSGKLVSAIVCVCVIGTEGSRLHMVVVTG